MVQKLVIRRCSKTLRKEWVDKEIEENMKEDMVKKGKGVRSVESSLQMTQEKKGSRDIRRYEGKVVQRSNGSTVLMSSTTRNDTSKNRRESKPLDLHRHPLWGTEE